MDDVSKLLPGLPSWITIPIVLFTIALTLVPRIYQVFADLTARSRDYKRESERLALLKLRYEIEALKKNKNLPDLPEPVLAMTPPQTPSVSSVKLLSALERFLYGASGAAIPPILALVITWFNPNHYSINQPWAYALAILILACVGGLASTAILRRRTIPLVCFLVGLSIVFLIRSILQEISQPIYRPPKTAPKVSLSASFPGENISLRNCLKT